MLVSVPFSAGELPEVAAIVEGDPLRYTTPEGLRVLTGFRCPLPAPGEPFFVGEVWYRGEIVNCRGESKDPPEYGVKYRADTGSNFKAPYPPDRWRQARTLPADFARSRFEVVDRRAARAGDLERGESWGEPDAIRVLCGAGMVAVEEQDHGLLPHYWPLWHRVPWNPEAWLWVVEVKSL